MMSKQIEQQTEQKGLPRRALLGEGMRCMALAAAAHSLTACTSVARHTPRSFAEYRNYDALGLASLVRSGDADPEELLEIAIRAVESLNPKLNFMAAQLYDHARNRLLRERPEGVFAGVPFLLKDLSIHLAGTPMSSGSRLFRNYQSDYTSTIVTRYQRAGLVMFGRTTSPEFGATPTTESLLYGATRNPWNPEYSAGGSSGGSAVAVSAGVVPAASASDGGGSIRIPASCCGLFGLKPSRGRTPYGPVQLEGSGGLSVLHVLSRSVRDSAALLDISAGPEPGSPQIVPAPERSFLEESARDPQKLRIAMIEDTGLGLKLHPDCKKALIDAAELCAGLGHEVETVDLGENSFENLPEALGVVMGLQRLRMLEKVERARGYPVSSAELEPVNLFILEQARRITALQYAEAKATFFQAARQIAQRFGDRDLILNPTMALPPPPLGLISLNQSMEAFSKHVIPFAVYTGIYNITGQPAMSVPLYWSRDGMPIGVMFAAPRNQEARLLQLAGQLERARPWFDRVPQVS